MKYMMIAYAAIVAILGIGAYASEPDGLPSFAKDGEVTWLCYSEGGAMSGMDFAVVVDLERHASGMFTGKQVRVVQAQLPGDGMTVLPADKWSAGATAWRRNDGAPGGQVVEDRAPA